MSDKKPTKVLTPEFRVSYPSLFKPSGMEGQDKKFSVVMLFPNGADLSAMKKAAETAVLEKWPDKDKRPKNIKSPFRDGDTEKAGVNGYEGVTFVTARSKTRPGVVDQNVSPIMDEQEVYPGCYARATVVAFAYDMAGNRGVSFALNNIQKLRDGEPLGGSSRAEDDFGPVEGSGDGVEESAGGLF